MPLMAVDVGRRLVEPRAVVLLRLLMATSASTKPALSLSLATADQRASVWRCEKIGAMPSAHG
jgi:hypothetical protein